MAIDGPTATIIASLIAATVIFLTVGGTVIYRLGRLEKGSENLEKAMAAAAAGTDNALVKAAADTEKSFAAMAADMDRRFAAAAADTERRFDRLEEIIRTEQDATRTEIRRLAEALASHTHDADGTTIFRIPPVNP